METKLTMRKLFGYMLMVGLLPTWVNFHKSAIQLEASDLILWIAGSICISMLLAVMVWISQGCWNLKEGYLLFFGFVVLSVASSIELNGWWLLFAWAIGVATLVGVLIYFVLTVVEVGNLDWVKSYSLFTSGKFTLVATVLGSLAIAKVVGQSAPNLLGVALAVLLSVYATLIVIVVWQDRPHAKNAVPFVVGFYFAGLTSLIALGWWPISVTVLAVSLLFSLGAAKKSV